MNRPGGCGGWSRIGTLWWPTQECEVANPATVAGRTNCFHGTTVDQGLDAMGHVPMREESRWVLDQEILRLTQLEEAVQRVERSSQATQGDAIVEKLLDQPDVGLVTALGLRAVIVASTVFVGQQLSSYCGIVPCNASSGKCQADAGLTNRGNPELRALLLQLAKRLPRREGHWRASPTVVADKAGQCGLGRDRQPLVTAAVSRDGDNSKSPSRTSRPRQRLSKRG